MLPTLKTCNCLLVVLLQHADLVLEPLHCFPFLFIVPVLLLSGVSQQLINACYFHWGIRRVVRQLQPLRRGEFSRSRPANYLKRGVGLAEEEPALGSLLELGGEGFGHGGGLLAENKVVFIHLTAPFVDLISLLSTWSYPLIEL
jgi:hypothetical protein